MRILLVSGIFPIKTEFVYSFSFRQGCPALLRDISTFLAKSSGKKFLILFRI
jgi:hypothetical protein